LQAYGVKVINEPIVLDNNIITSYCPQTAPGVAFQLLELLTSKDFTDTVRAAMGF
jgi:4-methyl-5(b-hydroxyethyl)-thiazole monophosphate biosynthesis